MRRALPLALLALALAFPALAAAPQQAGDRLQWERLPDLPPGPGQTVQPGVAGAFAGEIDGALIVAGGANFPDAPPWQGGAKKFYDTIFVLTGKPGAWKWTVATERLPRPIGYGVTVKTGDGLVLIGGCDTDLCYPDVTRLRRDPKTGKISFETLPALRHPQGFMGGAIIGDKIYIVGGQESAPNPIALSVASVLDLKKPGEGWKELPAFPGASRVLPVVAAQNDGRETALFVFSGRNVSPETSPEVLTDGWKFSLTSSKWIALAPVGPAGTTPRCMMAAPAVASGANHILVFSGDLGNFLLEAASIDWQIILATGMGDTNKAETLRAIKAKLQESHPGFSRDVLAYHTITGTWAKIGEIPAEFAAPVTTTAVPFAGGIVIPSGEIRPGVRTPQILFARPAPRAGFGTLNYLTLGAYLLGMVYIGWYFSSREKTTDDFFLAGGRVPWWAAGLSIFGTSLSAITFMAIPAKTFATDWRYLFLNLSQVLAAPIVIAVYLPIYRRLRVVTSYEYLERRFNPAVRLLGSLMFLLFQFGRFGIVLFLPSLALSVVTDINIDLCIVLMGTLTIFYTVMGGIEAVIWTDVVQVIVLMGGALFALVLIAFQLDGGVGQIFSVAAADGKFQPLDLSLSLVTPTVWVAVIGGLAHNLIYAGSDQTMAQRYLTTPTEQAAARGVWTFGIMAIPAAVIFFGVGTALYVFYQQHPALLDPTLANADAIFPWYIVTSMPPGLAGLLIAGVFAAAMSSLDSSMNSAATVIVTDFYRRFRPSASDASALRLAKWIAGLVGVLGTVIALLMARWEIVSLWDGFQKILGLFAGGLGGLFLLGMVSKRASGRGALVGLAASCVVQFIMGRYQPVHLLMFTFTGMASSVIFGWLASLALPDRDDRSKMTIWEIRKMGNGDRDERKN